MKHPCEIVYQSVEDPPIYGDVSGHCRVLNREAKGLVFDKWVKDTFTNYDDLHPGDIISNEALFCFDEKSEVIQEKTGRDKLQKFRTYSHFVAGGNWHVYTKANKREMFAHLVDGCEIAVMSDSGQKHLLFKHRLGFWQLEDQFILPDVDLLKHLHRNMQHLLALQFSQTEIISGDYIGHRIFKAGVHNWQQYENEIKHHRGCGVFDVAAWLLFVDEKIEINEQGRTERKTDIPTLSLFS